MIECCIICMLTRYKIHSIGRINEEKNVWLRDQHDNLRINGTLAKMKKYFVEKSWQKCN